VTGAVFLKSLSLKGFKSFADPTVMHLEPGVTVVVGPNGSGKSNVVDAIAWVLGAQAPSAVRSQKMDDVIFAGTATRPALGRAEVSLTIDNSAGLLGLGFTEITVSRILFRTGDSEYSINGVPCRLLDVQELLSDAGVGRQQHVIVSQGQIDAVLNARPEDRRGIVEEAAGVLKFRKRKEKAERRLGSTEASLLRLNDLLREVRRQLKPLQRQAEAASRHGDLIAELTALRMYVAGRQVASMRAALEAHTGARIEQQRADSELRSELARLDSNVLTLEAELSVRNTGDVSDRLIRVEQLRERSRGILALISERRRGVERDRGRLLDATLVASLERDLHELRVESETVDAQLARLAPEADQLAADETAFADERRGVLNLFGADPTAAASSAAAELRGELRSLRAGVERAEADHLRSADRHDRLARRAVDLRVEVDHKRAGIDAIESNEAGLEQELDDAGEALAAAEMDDAIAAGRRDAVVSASSRWSARVDALQLALDAAHSRSGSRALVDVDDVLGPLLDLVEIDAGWERAVQAALGDALEAIVVANVDAARAGVAALRAADAEGAVLALGIDGPAAGIDEPAPGAGVPGDQLRDHVHRRAGSDDDALDALLDRLLAHSVRISEVAEACEIAIEYPNAVVVTDVGDRFGAGGWRIGAGGDDGVTALALDEARNEATTATTELAAAKVAAEEALVALDGARRRQRLAQQAVDANHAARAADADGLDRLRHQLRDIDGQLESLSPEIAEQERHVMAHRTRIEELEELVSALERDAAAEMSAAQERSDRITVLDTRAELLASRRRELEVRDASLQERRHLLERRIGDTEERLAADATARDEAGARRRRLERTMWMLDEMHERLDAHRVTLEAEHQSLSERRRRVNEQVRELTTRLEQCRAARSDAEHKLEAQRERSRRTELDEAETRLRLEGVVETLRRDLSIEPETAERAERPELPDGATPAGRVRELERELRLLGPINPLALEEFNELQERHSFLESQLEDVRSTRRELNRVISAIDNEIQTVFAAAYTDVSANFAALFTMLFPGGTGKLVLTQPDDMLDTGIEVEAKPSGKNVKKLSLLSGGERSLTALAFLFAVFRSRPSPFYVMDEVEAALDDVNLHRFLGLLTEFRSEAQLLIVSHQKRTMEAGDCLLGVSMQPGGSSKVIAERITEPDDQTTPSLV